MTAFIVAEISKNWIDDVSVADTPPICAQFELLIEHNQARGYRLHTFTLHRLMTSINAMNETIIAVFERVEQQ